MAVGKPKTAEMHPGPGYRLRQHVERPSRETVHALGSYETPAVSDMMNRLYTMVPAIKPLTSADRIAGPACTVKVYPGDNLMVHKSLDLAEPGDVIVVDTSGSSLTAVLGDLVSTKARHREVAGFVVDGLIRDHPGIEALGDFPVFARGVTPIALQYPDGFSSRSMIRQRAPCRASSAASVSPTGPAPTTSTTTI